MQKKIGGKKMSKKKHDIGRIITKIVAIIIAAMMVLSVAWSLIYYLLIR